MTDARFFAYDLISSFVCVACVFSSQGEILLVAEDYDDGWMRGLRLKDMAVSNLKIRVERDSTSNKGGGRVI